MARLPCFVGRIVVPYAIAIVMRNFVITIFANRNTAFVIEDVMQDKRIGVR